ncbi:phosphoribosylglycinamide formyltransferase [Pseudomonas japonica]|uniref:phosphoribosylglycinamide formyltransferase 1 n=1 Tax=Pseudomonas japonica TaxID=256466 RepID=A0A239B052_9PSED|nr:formyltransferase family protein [Pseudomonas japonica]SNS01237.1 phosphoribosylglycinamide formyltransferase-1 [Pseudomonas japonica]
MIRIAFLCSGGGGNLRFISEVIRLGVLPAQLVSVITDRECLANRFALEHHIPSEVIDFSEPGQVSLARMLDAAGPDVVITNVHRIIVPEVVEAFAGRLLNLHYSLLPAYAATIGTTPVAAALEAGSPFTGVTAHLVDSGVDTGRPLVQGAIPLQPGDAVASVMDIVFRAGCLSLLNAILLHGGSPALPCSTHQLGGRPVFVNPDVALDHGLLDQAMWQRIADYPGSAH